MKKVGRKRYWSSIRSTHHKPGLFDTSRQQPNFVHHSKYTIYSCSRKDRINHSCINLKGLVRKPLVAWRKSECQVGSCRRSCPILGGTLTNSFTSVPEFVFPMRSCVTNVDSEQCRLRWWWRQHLCPAGVLRKC
ncbi:hypothetical protein E2C01_022224 [Portunus trituberculatus]|uniref:Uncharacterized protein n=1 Tax=Portunus trituberculatus TaxID=210409 RepID=A0A5B7E5E9_PORTR|nr:hypothetical protein [Portunus trituberculatus]